MCSLYLDMKAHLRCKFKVRAIVGWYNGVPGKDQRTADFACQNLSKNHFGRRPVSNYVLSRLLSTVRIPDSLFRQEEQLLCFRELIIPGSDTVSFDHHNHREMGAITIVQLEHLLSDTDVIDSISNFDSGTFPIVADEEIQINLGNTGRSPYLASNH